MECVLARADPNVPPSCRAKADLPAEFSRPDRTAATCSCPSPLTAEPRPPAAERAPGSPRHNGPPEDFPVARRRRGRGRSSSMVAFHASQSPFRRAKTSGYRSFRLARSRGSCTTSNRNSLPAIRRYFQSASRRRAARPPCSASKMCADAAARPPAPGQILAVGRIGRIGAAPAAASKVGTQSIVIMA